MKTAAIILCLVLSSCAVRFRSDGSRTFAMDLEAIARLYKDTP